MKRAEFHDGALFVWVKRGSPPPKEGIAKHASRFKKGTKRLL